MEYSKKTDRMDFYIKDKSIIVKLKWKYNWRTAIGVTSWGIIEKKEYQNKIEESIKKHWSNHFTVVCIGKSDFVKKHFYTRWKLEFEFESVSNNQHWNVYVTKIKPSTTKKSSVNWNQRKITIDSEDGNIRARYRNNKFYSQTPISHEFGHVIGNTKKISSITHSDEYKINSFYFSDKNSIMNVGNEIRNRHKDYIIQQLNTIIPNTNFA